MRNHVERKASLYPQSLCGLPVHAERHPVEGLWTTVRCEDDEPATCRNCLRILEDAKP